MINTGDTAWVLVCTGLVMLMTPGLAFFYGGMVRRKNILGILMQCFTVLCVLTLQWILFGYSLSFAPSKGFFGGLSWFGLNGVGFKPYADYAATIPHEAFMLFQAMFAVITPALIIGAFAERMKFSAFLLFTILWATFVYDPVCHWVWGMGGWLKELGVLDFAGGSVVHINAGIAALVTALMIGKRKGYENRPVPPHNLPFTVLGTALLWFGWFGFNAGSALAANEVAVHAFLVTHTAAAAAGATWALLEWILQWETDRLRHDHRLHRRPCHDHARFRFRDRRSRRCDRMRGECCLLHCCGRDKAQTGLRRLPRCLWGPRRRRHAGHARGRTFCVEGDKSCGR